jgi:hypothetical protein
MALAQINSADGVSWTGATNSTVGPFDLLGGVYLLGTETPGTSTVLNVLSPAGNYIPVTGGTLTSGTIRLRLPGGTYEVVTTSASAIAGFVQKVRHAAV